MIEAKRFIIDKIMKGFDSIRKSRKQTETPGKLQNREDLEDLQRKADWQYIIAWKKLGKRNYGIPSMQQIQEFLSAEYKTIKIEEKIYGSNPSSELRRTLLEEAQALKTPEGKQAAIGCFQMYIDQFKFVRNNPFYEPQQQEEARIKIDLSQISINIITNTGIQESLKQKHKNHKI